MNTTLFGILLTGASLLAQAPASRGGADTRNPTPAPTAERPLADEASRGRAAHMEQRASQQQKRIEEGVKSGQLTPKEAAKLEKRESRINKKIADAKADGKITPREAARIERKQNRASRKIFKEKHDTQKQNRIPVERR